MSGVTKQQTLRTGDGTALVIDSWLRAPGSITMEPRRSSFTATCPVHGEIDTSYASIMVMYAVHDHANDHHGGLASPADLLEVGPYIQM